MFKTHNYLYNLGHMRLYVQNAQYKHGKENTKINQNMTYKTNT